MKYLFHKQSNPVQLFNNTIIPGKGKGGGEKEKDGSQQIGPKSKNLAEILRFENLA